MAASEVLLRRVVAARDGMALNFREGEMTKDYSQVDIDGSGKLNLADFPMATIAIVGSIVALTAFLFVFLLVSL